MNKPSENVIDLRLIQLHKAVDTLMADGGGFYYSAVGFKEYDDFDSRMIEITKTLKKSVSAQDIYMDIQFKHIVFPETVHFLLQPGDVFQVLMGRYKSRWYVLELSPPYETEDDGEDLEELQMDMDI